MNLLETVTQAERIVGAAPGELFDDLSKGAQAECWAELREQHDRRNEFLAYGDDLRERPKRHLRAVAPCTRASSNAGVARGRHDDPLRAVPLPVAFEILTGESVPRSGMVRCPLPDHEDRTPSCRVAEDVFYCHGCLRGGSAIDLAAHLYGLEPRGAGFFEIRRRLALDLLGREEAAA